jgi:hypothetical protein
MSGLGMHEFRYCRYNDIRLEYTQLRNRLIYVCVCVCDILRLRSDLWVNDETQRYY